MKHFGVKNIVLRILNFKLSVLFISQSLNCIFFPMQFYMYVVNKSLFLTCMLTRFIENEHKTLLFTLMHLDWFVKLQSGKKIMDYHLLPAQYLPNLWCISYNWYWFKFMKNLPRKQDSAMTMTILSKLVNMTITILLFNNRVGIIDKEKDF